MKIINSIQVINRDAIHSPEYPKFEKILSFDNENIITCHNIEQELYYNFELKASLYDSKEAGAISDFINECECEFMTFIDEYESMKELIECENNPDTYLEDTQDYLRHIGFSKR